MSEDFFFLWKIVYLNLLPVSVWELFDSTSLTWFWQSISLFSIANPLPRNMFMYGDHISKELFKFDPYYAYNNMVGEILVPFVSYNDDGFYSKTYNYFYLFLFCKQVY